MTDDGIDRYGPAVKSLPGLVAFWRLGDATGSAIDASGNGHDGTYLGSPVREIQGIEGAGADRAVRFDGVNDLVSVSYRAALNTASWSVTAWARADGLPTESFGAVVSSRGGAVYDGFTVNALSTGVWELWVGTTVDAFWQTFQGGPIVLGKWTFFAATCNGSTVRFYVDGILRDTRSVGTYRPTTTGPYRIGASEYVQLDNWEFAGLIDEVAHFNVVLTAAQIADLTLIGAPVSSPRRSERRRGAVAVSAELWLADSNGVKVRRIDAFLADGSSAKIVHNIDTEPKLQLTASLSRRAGLVPFADWIIPVLTIRWSGGVVEGPRDMGHFMVVPPPVAHTAGDSLETITGMDLTYRIKQATYKRGRNLVAGQPYTTAIAEVLATLGILPERINIPPSAKIIPKRINVKPGGEKLGVINQMLEAIGYYTLTANLEGDLVSWPYTDIHTVEPAQAYTEDDVLSDPVKEDPDLTRFCNVAIVRRIQTGKSTIYAVAINDREESPASTVSLGGGVIDADGDRVRVEVTRVTDDNEIADNAAAQVIANKIRDEGESYYQRMSFRTKPTVDLGFHQTVSLDLANPAGVVAEGRFYRQSWTLGFTAATAIVEQIVGRVEPYR